MKYTDVALKNKILEMYPDIADHNVSVSVVYNEHKNAYMLTFRRGNEKLITYIDKMDADDCINNILCVHLGIKVDEFIRNFEARAEFGKQVA